MSIKVRIAACGAALVLGAVAIVVLSVRDRDDEPTAGLRELPRSELDLRDGILFARGEFEPFEGTLVEFFPGGQRRIALEIRDGRAHGLSRGWYENGQIEVDEHFVRGVSHGLRTRWHENGKQKSEAHIIDGQVEGTFTRWHENGTKAAEVTMAEGVPHGVSESWDASGKLQSRAVMKRGELVEREFFEKRDERRAVQTSS